MKHFTQWMQEGIDQSRSDMEWQITRRLMLANGVSLSIQASHAAYSIPRIILPYAEYSAMEIGYPSERIESLMEYAEDPERPTNTVYPYVPVEVLEKVIAEAGGVIGYPIIKPV